MLTWSVVFLVLAVVSGVFGLESLAGPAASLAKGAFILFICLFGLSLAAGWTERRLTHHPR